MARDSVCEMIQEFGLTVFENGESAVSDQFLFGPAERLVQSAVGRSPIRCIAGLDTVA